MCDADQKKKIYDIVNSIVVDFASTISGDTEKAIMSFRCTESTDFGDLVRAERGLVEGRLQRRGRRSPKGPPAVRCPRVPSGPRDSHGPLRGPWRSWVGKPLRATKFPNKAKIFKKFQPFLEVI